MKQQTNEVVQVQLDDEIKNLQIEPAELAGVTAETALQLLGEHLARNRFRLTRSTSGGTPFWDISAPPRVTRVFSVRGFLNNRAGEAQAGAVEALISALEAALDLGSQSELEANFRIHPYTGLLLVSARQNQVDIIEQVVSQLDKAQTVSDDSVRDLKARIEALEREVRDLREELDRRPQTRNFPQEEHSRDAVPNLQLRTAEPRNRKPD
jgi:TolA-binding protein